MALSVVIFVFSLVHHRFGARSDCGLGLRPLPAFAFLGFRFFALFVLLLTSLPLDDRDVWLAVVFSPLGLQVCSLRSVCGSLTPGRGVRLVARGPLLCPVTPRESAVRVLVLRCVLTGLFAVLGYFCVFRDI